VKQEQKEDGNACSSETEAGKEVAVTLENKKIADTGEKAAKQKRGREKRRRKKLFAKSVL
jgi:hypothetical protein